MGRPWSGSSRSAMNSMRDVRDAARHRQTLETRIHDVSNQTMHATVIYAPRDVRFEDVAAPAILEPTDAILSPPATCICGSDLWPYRGDNPIAEPAAMGHEYCG